MKQSPRSGPRQGKGDSHPLLLPLLFYALGVAAYLAFRYGGNWLDTDTTALTRAAQATLDQATLNPGREAYGHGFTYPLAVAWIAQLAGLSIPTLQTVILPMAGAVALAVVALALFRALLGEWMPAALATLMLYLQPDFLFVTFRGSHEKFIWPLAMLALLILYRSAGRPQGLRRLAVHVGLFYLTVFALIATNTFFASMFITAITLGLVLGLVVGWWQHRRSRQPPPSDLQRLALISAAGMVGIFLFMFYIYTPAGDALRFLRGIADRVATLFVGFEAQAAPYEYISTGWIDPRVWWALTLFTWSLLLGSLAEWLYQGRRLLRGATLHLPEALPWLLYAGFAGQIAAAVALDFAGVLAANMQLRILPGLTIFAVALAAQGLSRLLSRAWVGGHHHRFLFAGLALLAGGFTVASLLKASNDPIVSNKWGFYSPAEKSALRWTDTHLQYAGVWMGMDERLPNVYGVFYADRSDSGNVYDVYTPESTTRFFLLSETEQLRHARVGLPLPAVSLENQVYDNGEAQLYHKRPRTPYQR